MVSGYDFPLNQSIEYMDATHEYDLAMLCPTKNIKKGCAYLDDYSMRTVCVHFPAQCLVDSVSLYYVKHLLDGSLRR